MPPWKTRKAPIQLDLSAAAGGTGYLKFDLGATSDRITLATGILNIGSGLDFDDFTFSDAGGFGPGTYVLFDSGTDIIGDLGVNLASNILGFEATLDFAGGANGRDDLVLNVIPEPSTGVSLLGGLGLLLGWRRRRR